MSNGILNVQVKEYPVINELVILDKGVKNLEINFRITGLKQKDSFIENRLTKDVEIIKKIYATAGFNFVNVNTKIRKINDSNLDLIFEIDRGKETRISKISFTGDKKIKEKRISEM